MRDEIVKLVNRNLWIGKGIITGWHETVTMLRYGEIPPDEQVRPLARSVLANDKIFNALLKAGERAGAERWLSPDGRKRRLLVENHRFRVGLCSPTLMPRSRPRGPEIVEIQQYYQACLDGLEASSTSTLNLNYFPDPYTELTIAGACVSETVDDGREYVRLWVARVPLIARADDDSDYEAVTVFNNN